MALTVLVQSVTDAGEVVHVFLHGHLRLRLSVEGGMFLAAYGLGSAAAILGDGLKSRVVGGEALVL